MASLANLTLAFYPMLNLISWQIYFCFTDDIEVLFYEFNETNTKVWKRKGIFKPDDDVHKNFAICFKTPLYTNPIEVSTHLRLF